MRSQLKIISNDLLQEHLAKVDDGLQSSFDNLEDAEISTSTFKALLFLRMLPNS